MTELDMLPHKSLAASEPLGLRSSGVTGENRLGELMNSAHAAQEEQRSTMEPEKEKMSETSSEPSQSSASETAPTAFGRNGLPQHCPWCGRRIRSRKMVRQITRAPEGAHTTPLGHPIATGDFLCVSSCYLAWLNSIGHFKYA